MYKECAAVNDVDVLKVGLTPAFDVDVGAAARLSPRRGGKRGSGARALPVLLKKVGHGMRTAARVHQRRTHSPVAWPRGTLSARDEACRLK